ncbi:MAG: FAD-dependent oxidoreductase, partial [Planctomycetales bacterium]|nr:FAD-dependent oxidoreductase [Planctomycetales bacterium]
MLGVASALCWATAFPLACLAEAYDVIVCGGSAAALAAAFTAAEEGASVALIEPTDWIGGQFTASGVPAVDEAWHRIRDPESGIVLLDVAKIARDPRNITPFLHDALSRIGNPGRGWVSRYCFQPREILEGAFLPRERRLSDRLTVYRNTVVKS